MYFVRTIAQTDAEAEAAGFDVPACRERLERSFEAPLRWTDLTTTSALPRSTPMSGYLPETIVHGSVTTGAVLKTFFDTATCTDDRQCMLDIDGRILDCSYTVDWFIESHAIEARVQLATEDQALDATLDGSLQLALDGPPTGVLTFGSRTAIAGVQGTLRVEPQPGANRGSVDLYLGYFDASVRGRLELNFTSGWRDLPGVPLQHIDDRPLVAALQEDGCPFNTPPAPLLVAHDILGGQTPADALASLRSVIARTDPSATWTHVGDPMTFDVEIESPDYACVTRLQDLEAAPDVWRGGIVNLPVRLTSSDGLLDWPALATYELGGTTADVPHRLWFEQELTPVSSLWREAFPGFELAPHTDRIFLRFAARYPEAAPETTPASGPASAVFEIYEQSGCPSNDPVCIEEQADGDAAACLVSPPEGACLPSNLIDRNLFF